MTARPRVWPTAIGMGGLVMSVVLSTACNDDPSPSAPRGTQLPADSVARHAAAATPGSPLKETRTAAVPPAPRPSGPLPPGTSCVSAECHAGFATARFVHGPIGAGDCSSCHDQDTGEHEYPLKRAGNETCTFCHPISGRRTHQHQALQGTGCTSCHRPHASDTKFLLTSPSVELVCAQCHVIPRKPSVHAPFAAGECTACHEPHEANAPGLLRGGAGAAHCYLCHADIRHAIENAPHVHAPAAAGCTNCHHPHSSDHDHQLTAATTQLCFSCHPDVEKHVKGARAPHAAVFTGEACANCHDPHAAGRPDLLRDRTDRLCLTCHDQPVQTADGRTIPDMRSSLTAPFLHGPVKSGNCSACHNAHGAAHARLLSEAFPESFYASFDLQNYALCFNCHDKQLVLSERTTSLTDFRDGDVNLHYLHVNRADKGRTCKTCHAIHGSGSPQHVAADVPFEGSQWAMPIRFVPAADGGSCAPGCHQPLTYRRRGPANSSTAPSSGGAR